MKYLIIIAFFCCANSSHAIDVPSLLKKIQEVYASKSISYTSTYKLFKGHKSTTVHSSYQGEVYSDGKRVYQKIKNTEFVYGSDFFLKISNDEKAMVLDLAQQINQSEINLDQALKECSSSRVIEKENHYTIVFRFKSTSTIPCSIVKMNVDKKNYTMKRIDLYYAYQQDFSSTYLQKDMHQPHLRIEIDNVKLNPKKRPHLFKLSTYLSTSNSILVLTEKYKNYQLIDNRIN
ncbi:MAG: hypothetical protein JKY09_04425 [Crocinitomicaceae bacterium]|nr:hypothetical protein [Crocinitomicaceae bacterium]